MIRVLVLVLAFVLVACGGAEFQEALFDDVEGGSAPADVLGPGAIDGATTPLDAQLPDASTAVDAPAPLADVGADAPALADARPPPVDAPSPIDARSPVDAADAAPPTPDAAADATSTPPVCCAIDPGGTKACDGMGAWACYAPGLTGCELGACTSGETCRWIDSRTGNGYLGKVVPCGP